MLFIVLDCKDRENLGIRQANARIFNTFYTNYNLYCSKSSHLMPLDLLV